MNALFLTTTDPSLGRIDSSSMSQQTLMELFSKGIITNDTNFPDASTDVSTWEGLTVENDEVIFVEWECIFLQGTIDLEWLPSTVERVMLFENELIGTLNLTSLPEALTEINLAANSFSGSVDLTSLPDGLRILVLDDNELRGTLDFTNLPVGMNQLHLSRNWFTGECDFRHLPDGLTFLDVGHTKLVGELLLKKGQVNNFVVDESGVTIAKEE